jgi:putative FmdB family regulatory protein
MPLFDFRCPKCQTIFERRVLLAARDEPVECPACGSLTKDRLVALPAAMARGENQPAATGT